MDHTGHDQDAEDVAQEAYIMAFRSFDKHTEINSLGRLLTIVRNTSYRWVKSKYVRKQQAEFDEALHSSKLEPGHTAERHIETRQEKFFSAMGYKELLNNALKNMPLIFREVIALHEIEGLSYKEIAMSSVYRWGRSRRGCLGAEEGYKRFFQNA